MKAQEPLIIRMSLCVLMAAIGGRHLHLSQCDQKQNFEVSCDNHLLCSGKRHHNVDRVSENNLDKLDFWFAKPPKLAISVYDWVRFMN